MSRIQRFIVTVMGLMVACVLCAVFVVAVIRYREFRAFQAALVPTATPLPMMTYPPTYTPIPTVGTAAALASPTPAAASAQPGETAVAAPATKVAAQAVKATSPEGIAIEKAMGKLQTAETFRFEMDMGMQGDLGSDVPPGYLVDGKMSMLNATGAVKGKDSSFALKGLLAALFGADPAKGVEFMTVSGKSYIRGPMAFLGITDDKWYVSESSEDFGMSGSSSPESMVKEFNSETNMDGIVKTGQETFDGQLCDVYLADTEMTLRSMNSMKDSQIPTSNMTDIQKAETRVWVCADGYFHKLQMEMSGSDPKSPGKKVGMNIFLHMYDFDGAFTLTPPADAQPFKPNLNFNLVTPTPKPF